MNWLCKRCRTAFLSFVHLFYKHIHCFVCNHPYLLSNCAYGNDCFSGDWRIIKSYDFITFRKATVFFKDNIKKNIGMCIIWHKNSQLFIWIQFFKLFKKFIDTVVIIIKIAAEFSKNKTIFYVMTCTEISKSAYSAIRWYIR